MAKLKGKIYIFMYVCIYVSMYVYIDTHFFFRGMAAKGNQLKNWC